MILYHGSNVEVSKPEIIKTIKGRDFGRGFYATPIKKQAERMAKRKQRVDGGSAIVSVFEWDEDVCDLKYKNFKSPDLEWIDMIVACRSNPAYKHSFDIVEGKIADDTVGSTVNFVVNGVIKKDDAIERLKFQEINSQLAFCSEKALKHIKFIKSYEVL